MDRTNEAITCLKNLIRIPSVEGIAEEGAPFGRACRDALDYMEGELRAIGMRTVSGEGYYCYGELGEAGKPLFGILGHLDVVPVTEGWRHQPFSGDIADGYLWGRGALDDKGPMVAALYAVKELLDEGLTPKMRLRFIFGANEESGWRCMDRYKEREETPDMGFSPDADFPVIHCEKGVAFLELDFDMPEAIKEIKSGTRANIVPDYAEAIVRGVEVGSGRDDVYVTTENGEIKVVAYGRSAHGSTPEEGDNALVKLLSYIGQYDADSRAIAEIFADRSGKGLGLDVSDDISGRATFNAGVAGKEGERLKISVDVRYPVTFDLNAVKEAVRKSSGCKEITVKGAHAPLYVAEEHPLVQTLLAAYKKVSGDEEAKPIVIGGATYARVLPLGVGFGPIFPGEESLIHRTDERISLEGFARIKEIYKEAIRNLCF